MQARGLRRGSLINLAGAVGGSVSTLLLVLVTARLLSPPDAGRVFGLTSAFLIAAAVLRAGTPTAVVLFLARLDDASTADARRVSRLALLPVLGASVLVGLAAAPFAPALADRAGLEGTGGTVTVLVLLAALPAGAVLEPLLAVTRSRRDMVPTVTVDRVGRPVLQLALTVVAALAPSTATVVAAWCVPYVVALVAAYLLTPELRRDPDHDSRPAAPVDVGAFAGFVAARGVTTVVQVAFSRLDIVLVAALAGPGEAAVYTVATRFVVVTQLAQQAIATASEPALASALAGGRREEALEIHRTSTAWLVSLAWPLLLAAAVLAPVWLAWFGASYASSTHAVDVVLVLTAAMLLAMGVGGVETVLTMHGRAAVLVITNVVALLVMVAVDVVLVPHHGALGAAVGWAGAITVKNLAGLVLASRALGGTPFDRGWLLAAAANLLIVGLVPAVAGTWGGDVARVLAVVVCVPALAFVYARYRTPLRLDGLVPRRRTMEKTC